MEEIPQGNQCRITTIMSTKLIKVIEKEIRDYPPVAYLSLKRFLDILKERKKRIKEEDARRKNRVA